MKSNIEIVKDYLAGERPFVQVGYTPSKIKRKVGDEWEDVHGITWRQEVGYKKRVNKQADLIREARKQICVSCKNDIKWGSKFDSKFFNRTGLCEKCLIDYETKLRVVGVYDDYERYKLISYELGFVRDAKSKIEEVIKFFGENDGDIEMICNSEGFIEKWKNTNQEQILKDAINDLKLAKKRISDLTKAKTVAKKKYEAGAHKYQLETYAT